MANPQRFETSLVAGDGKTYTLVFDINSISELEAHLSTPDRVVVWQEIAKHLDRGSLQHVRAVIWAALQRHHPKMTIEQAGDLVADVGLQKAMDKIAVMGKSTHPDPEDVKTLGLDKKKAPRPRKAQAP